MDASGQQRHVDVPDQSGWHSDPHEYPDRRDAEMQFRSQV